MRGLPRPLSHRTASFWVWLGVWLVSGLMLLLHAELLWSRSAGSATRALEQGQRLIVDAATGKVTGHIATPETPEPAKPEPEQHAPAEPEAAPAPPAESPAPEAPNTPEDTRSPAARIPAQKHPEVQATDLPSPAPDTGSTALAPLLPALQEESKDGPLPIVGPEGETPLHHYARPAAAAPEGKPRIALMVVQLGLNPALAQAVLGLPPEVSVSVSPYAPKPADWLALARNRGHEALLDLPLEPRDFPISDAGPYALSPREDPEENLRRLHWVLSRGGAYVGLAASPHEHFLSQSSAAAPLLRELKKRGLLLVSSSPRAALTMAQAHTTNAGAQLTAGTVLDEVLSPEAIDAQLAALVSTARTDGQALALFRPYPLSLARVKHWMETLEAQGIVLVPATALLAETKQTPAPAPAHE